MVLTVPISRDLLIVLIEPLVILLILVISVLSSVLTIFILVAILIVRILSVLGWSRAAGNGQHDGHTGGNPKALHDARHKSSSWYSGFSSSAVSPASGSPNWIT
jgi:hypothetical protein